MEPSSEQEFSQRHEWMRHVQKTHWYVYPCLLGCTCVLSSPSAYSSHLSKNHPSSLAQDDIDALVRLAAQPLDIEAGIPCPLCGDGEILRSKKEYRRHVCRHQEQLSLFALPRNLTDQDGDDDDDGDDGDGEMKSGQDDAGHSDGTAEGGSVGSDRETQPNIGDSVLNRLGRYEGHMPTVERSVDETEDQWAKARPEKPTPSEGDASSVKSVDEVAGAVAGEFKFSPAREAGVRTIQDKIDFLARELDRLAREPSLAELLGLQRLVAESKDPRRKRKARPPASLSSAYLDAESDTGSTIESDIGEAAEAAASNAKRGADEPADVRDSPPTKDPEP